MALINCSECGNGISDKAISCPKCGSPTENPLIHPTTTVEKKSSHGIFHYVAWATGIVVVVFFGSAVIAGIAESGHRRALANDPNAIHADEIVSLMSGAFACDSKTAFLRAAQHQVNGEMAAWADIVTKRPSCFSSSDLSDGQLWMVLQVREDLMQVSTSVTSKGKVGPDFYGRNYWTRSSFGFKSTENSPSK
jgi:hypothetical protein